MSHQTGANDSGVSNTASPLFRYEQTWYFLVAGRWFTTANLERGPWRYTTDLPTAFSQIPPDHSMGAVLASVPELPDIVHQNTSILADEMVLVHDYDGEVDTPVLGAELADAIGSASVALLVSHGVIVTAPGQDAEVDFVSRFFAPAVGVPEDPVTGSAHCVLAPYWAGELGKTRMAARQVSARGGDVGCELRGERVVLSGHAALYARGEIVDP